MSTVYQALAHVMKDVREVRKNGRNKQQGFNFRGVDDVMNAVGPALREHGVVVSPTNVEHTIASKNTAKGALMNFATVKVEYTVFGPDGSHFTGQVAAESFDSGDKATAKAMSVAFRTFLLQTLCLPTDDADPDEDTYNETRPGNRPRAQGNTGPDWPAMFQDAQKRGPMQFANWLKWARSHNGPAEMIAEGQAWLEQQKPVEGEVITNGNA